MTLALTPLGTPLERKGPLLLIIMDGVAIGEANEGDAVHLARTPTLDKLQGGMWRSLRAHGTAVGMPGDGDMGNSEVGHNALGAGRVFAQGATLVANAIESGELFNNAPWQDVIKHCQSTGGALHLLGLLSDGNVHSHERHLHALLRQAAAAGLPKARVHILLDGRDVEERSALVYVERLEALLSELSVDGREYRIASGGGRMLVTMDRYEAEWKMVERGWQSHVLGQGRSFASAAEAIQTYREELGVNDQYLPAFVIHEDNEPVGAMQDGDACVLFNFRGDRAIEICRAFEEEDFPYFDRQRVPRVHFAGMMEYDGDNHIPARFLVPPPQIDNTVSEYLADAGVRQWACSETQKYGHVTYFWNGNRPGKFSEELETYVEIPSDLIPCEQRPWMKAAEITDALIEALRSEQYQFLRVNYPNGDMVGHTGDLEAAILSVEVVDLCLARVLKVVEEVGGIALVTADHGNSDQMYGLNKDGSFKKDSNGQRAPLTSHTLNPVPLYFFDPDFNGEYGLQEEEAGLSNVAATMLQLLGYEPPEDYDASLLTWKEA
jgi:2,3-bisphosphoglycerate-independent phosphoglycerate mutase